MIETFIKVLSKKCLQASLQSARKTAINIAFNTIYTRILTVYITLRQMKNFGVVQQSRPAKFNIYTPPTLAGLFFCLAPAEGAGLLFCPATIQPHTSVYSAFCAVHAELYRPHRKAAHSTLQWRFRQLLLFNYHRYQTDTSGYNTACATLERITAP